MSDEQNKYQENYKSKVLTDKHFSHVLSIIHEGKHKAINSVNKVLIETYFRVGAYLSKQVNSNNWGKSIVSELSKRLKSQYPELRGYSVQNLWRMKQIYELYQDDSKLSPLVREIPKQNKREHENPTIGVLLCKSKDEEVVELALNTSMSPALVSEYKTKMIPKELLKKKLLEWSSDIENSDFEGGEL